MTDPAAYLEALAEARAERTGLYRTDLDELDQHRRRRALEHIAYIRSLLDRKDPTQ